MVWRRGLDGASKAFPVNNGRGSRLIQRAWCGMWLIFSGADGSGKTTVSRLLYGYLASRGVVVCLHWFRGSHFLASILLRFLSWFRVFQGFCNPYYRVCLPEGLKLLWIYIEFISLLPHLLARRLLRRLCFIVGDRGALDFVAWLVATLGRPGFVSSVLGRFLLGLALREGVYTSTQIH